MSNIRVRLKNREEIKAKLRPQQGVQVDNQKLYLYDESLIDDEVALARDWAIKTDGLVEEEDYSSKAWAIGGTGTETNNSKYYAGLAQGFVNIITPIASDITTVASISSDVTAVANNASNINTVASNISDVNTVAGSITNVNKVGSDINRVNLVADDISSVHTVAVDISNVIDVASNISDINSVAADLSNIDAVAADLTNIDNASTYADNANIWAEGTDTQVQALGGTHSAKVWASSLGTVYKPAGSIAFASLPTLGSTYEGYVYNVTDSFTTTSDFIEGAGKSYPAGTNVVCIDTGSSVYKWDILGGFVDLSGYQPLLVSGTNIKTINNSSVLGSGNLSVGTVKSVNSTSPDGSGNVTLSIPAAQIQSDWTQADNTKLDYIKNKPTIPTVNNATLTITQGGSTKGTFTANASSDVTIDLDAGGGTSRNIGEIVESTIPLTDAGLHLLDGSLLVYGSYADFIDYIGDLYDSGNYPDIFETEANWQTSVTNYGVCGKFVYDSVNQTVRLPKISSDKRYLIKSYNDGGHAWYRIYSDGWCEQGDFPTLNGVISATNKKITFDIPYTRTPDVIAAENANTGVSNVVVGWESTTGFCIGTLSGSNTGHTSWIARGYTDISGYKDLQKYQYIVIANSVKTQIEVDIDEIATDLNGKADIDLSNTSSIASGFDVKLNTAGIRTVVETYINGSNWYRIWSDGWIEQGGKIYIPSGNATLVFLKAFSDTNYTMVAGSSNNTNVVNVNMSNARTTAQTLVDMAGSNSGDAFWYACGY